MFWEYSPIPRHTLASVVLGAGLMAGLVALVAPRLRAAESLAAPPPTATQEAREDYAEFLRAPGHRAFAIAPGGAWGMATDATSQQAAESEALAQCRESTTQTCRLYAVDRRLVFNQAAWDASWRQQSAAAAAAVVGTEVGERFPDLVFTGPDGASHRLSDYRGKVVVLHFWGSWCPICQRELPDLAKLAQAAAHDPAIRIIAVQAREPIAKARRWAALHDIALPLYDGGGDDVFHLANGTVVPDRSLAHNFPSTYVLDPQGVVVFRNIGALQRWPDYLPLLAELAQGHDQRTAAR